jgi:hypothetical protein
VCVFLGVGGGLEDLSLSIHLLLLFLIFRCSLDLCSKQKGGIDVQEDAAFHFVDDSIDHIHTHFDS